MFCRESAAYCPITAKSRGSIDVTLVGESESSHFLAASKDLDPSWRPIIHHRKDTIVKQVLLEKTHQEQLIANGLASLPNPQDHHPVVCLMASSGSATWLLSELLPEDHEIAFGLIDQGDGRILSGFLDLKQLEGLRDPYGLGVERNKMFKATAPLSKYLGFALQTKHGLRDCQRVLGGNIDLATVHAQPVPRPARDLRRAQLAVQVRALGLGRLHVANGAANALRQAGADVMKFLKRHAEGDWGDINQDDWQANDHSALGGGRTYSTYILNSTTSIWVVSEADRSATGVFLPGEFI
jgi:hypothetical protein